jgi:phosphotransferase system HPr (HPr) family protein
MIAQRCKNFASDVRLRNGTVVVDCRSVLDLLSMGASNGTSLHLEVTGEDAAEVVEAITAMFEARFNEDDESSRCPT